MRLNYKNIINLRKLASSPKRLFVALLVFMFLFVLNSCVMNTQSIEGKVVKVVDGDTIELLDQKKQKHRIRFFGIDAPESKQAFGKKSKDFLASLIAGKEIQVEKKGTDKYGRITGIIKFQNKDINKIMVENGFAWAYSYYSDKYTLEQEKARKNKAGLWTDKNPIEPYQWRKSHKEY